MCLSCILHDIHDVRGSICQRLPNVANMTNQIDFCQKDIMCILVSFTEKDS